jgi:hypothetical protein
MPVVDSATTSTVGLPLSASTSKDGRQTGSASDRTVHWNVNSCYCTVTKLSRPACLLMTKQHKSSSPTALFATAFFELT